MSETVAVFRDENRNLKVEIVKSDNEKYFNYYYSDDMEHWNSNAGPFKTEEEAREMVQKHRPTVKEESANLKAELVVDNIRNYINNLNTRDEWDYPIEDIDEARNNNDFLIISEIDNRVYEVTESEFKEIKEQVALENDIKERIEQYDKHQEELNKEWQEINNLKPNNMDYLDFQRLIQKARYETRQLNLNNEMLNSFEHNNLSEVKQWIHKGADKQKLYDYVSLLHSRNISLTMNQAWLLEDLHNIRKEKHFPYTYDREISDPRIINKEAFNWLYKKFEEKENTGKDTFTEDEKDMFLLKDGDCFIIIDNLSGNLYTEEFEDRSLAVRYIQGESIDKLRDEEQRYEVLIYETKEDYDKGEPFQENVYSDLNEAKRQLDHQINLNNYYAGNVLDQLTGDELYAITDEEESEEDCL